MTPWGGSIEGQPHNSANLWRSHLVVPVAPVACPASETPELREMTAWDARAGPITAMSKHGWSG